MDRNSSVCAACGFGFTPILHSHHIRPRSEGGYSDPGNLVFLCPNCHALVHQLYKLGNPNSDTGDIDGAYQQYLDLKEWIRDNLGGEVFDRLLNIDLTRYHQKDGRYE